jgi:hypothetical protein
MFKLSDQILHDLAQDGTAGALREKLTTMAASVEEDAFVKLVAPDPSRPFPRSMVITDWWFVTALNFFYPK